MAAVVVAIFAQFFADDPVNMPSFFAAESTQAASHNVRLNDVALKNILVMSVTRDTSHFEMSTLKDVAS